MPGGPSTDFRTWAEIPEGSDILFLTNAAYIQNFDKAPTAKSANRTSSESKDTSSLAISAESRGRKARANSDLIIQCIEEKKRHNSVGVKIVQYHKSPLLIETHDRATEAMAKTRKEFHQKNKWMFRGVFRSWRSRSLRSLRISGFKNIPQHPSIL